MRFRKHGNPKSRLLVRLVRDVNSMYYLYRMMNGQGSHDAATIC
jgi:hypothetical protein